MVFKEYADAGFGDVLLPILPVDAGVSGASRHPEALLKNRGKIPAKRTTDGWVGFHAWSEYRADAADVARWDRWGCGAGFQARSFPGLDIDVDLAGLAGRIEQLAARILGPAPARFGRGARRVLPYSTQETIRKRRVAFRAPAGAGGDDSGAGGDAEGNPAVQGPGDGADQLEVHAVELLGDGQQYVVEGIHPKTGKPYYWRDGISPVELGRDGLWQITFADVDRFFDELEALLRAEGCELVSGEDAGRSSEGLAWSEGLRAPSLEALERALAAIPNEADYDDWLRVMAACKGAGGEDAYSLFADWSASSGKDVAEVTQAKWDSLHAPFAIGWPHLSGLAKLNGFNAAAEEFTEAEDETEAGVAEARAAGGAMGDMFKRCVWIKQTEQALDLVTMELLNRQQFNAEFWMVGDPADGKKCAWAVFMRHGRQRRSVRSLTYRPGGALFVVESGLGECVNVWRPGEDELPATAADADVAVWLDHMAYLVPDATERMHLLDWLAWVVQHPAEKPNWGVLLGSPWQGIGKSLMLEPVRAALGRHNVREVGPSDVSSGYTNWLVETKLFVVEEMHSFERRETMNRLKNLLATPPWRLQINPKYGKQFDIPNIVAGVFFTNHENALALERTDRRFYVLWSEVRPKSPDYYRQLAGWFKSGGAERAARWLLDRDVSQFDAHGRAPDTAAKEDMRKSSRNLLDEWLEDGMAEGYAPFVADLVTLEDVYLALPDSVFGRGQKPTRQRLASAIKRAGAQPLGRLRLGDGKAQLFSVRRHVTYSDLGAEELRDLFTTQRHRALAAGEFK